MCVLNPALHLLGSSGYFDLPIPSFDDLKNFAGRAVKKAVVPVCLAYRIYTDIPKTDFSTDSVIGDLTTPYTFGLKIINGCVNPFSFLPFLST